MGRQHQGMDRPGVRQVPEGSGEQGKMENTGCKIICGAPTTRVVKGLMMMMMKTHRVQDFFNCYIFFCCIYKILRDLLFTMAKKDNNNNNSNKTMCVKDLGKGEDSE